MGRQAIQQRYPSPDLSWPPSSQMTLVLQEPRLCSEGLALVLWVRPLMPLLEEEPRATGHRGSPRKCHCLHFF